MTPSDLEHRRPVWLAISELFLDTNLDSADLTRIAKTLAQSPYSLEELDDILLWEVYPACWTNTYAIAGEWAGFDPEWLEARIKRRPWLLTAMWTATVGRLARSSSLSWRRIKRRVNHERSVG